MANTVAEQRHLADKIKHFSLVELDLMIDSKLFDDVKQT